MKQLTLALAILLSSSAYAGGGFSPDFVVGIDSSIFTGSKSLDLTVNDVNLGSTTFKHDSVSPTLKVGVMGAYGRFSPYLTVGATRVKSTAKYNNLANSAAEVFIGSRSLNGNLYIAEKLKATPDEALLNGYAAAIDVANVGLGKLVDAHTKSATVVQATIGTRYAVTPSFFIDGSATAPINAPKHISSDPVGKLQAGLSLNNDVDITAGVTSNSELIVGLNVKF